MGVSGRSTPSNWAPRGFLKDLLLVKIPHTQTHTSICVCVFVLIICDSPLGTTAHLINWHLYKWDLITDLYPSFFPLCLSHTFFNTHWFSHCLYSCYLSVFFCSSLSLSLSLSVFLCGMWNSIFMLDVWCVPVGVCRVLKMLLGIVDSVLSVKCLTQHPKWKPLISYSLSLQPASE